MSLISQPILRPSVRIGPAEMQGGLVLEGTLREGEGEGSWLKPLVDDLHRRAIARDVAEVVLDIRRVDYANAAAWKCFVHWLRLAREDPSARYTVKILASATQRWQQLGLPALRAFGGTHLEVHIYDGDKRIV